MDKTICSNNLKLLFLNKTFIKRDKNENQKQNYKINNKYIKLLISYIDLIIIVLVTYFLIHDFMLIIISLFKILIQLGLNNEFVNYMVDNFILNNIEGHTTNVQVIHDAGSWSNGIRSLFIYGTGVLRISLLKGGGTPSSKAFVIASTIGADTLVNNLFNIINDPKYIRSQVENWKTIWNGKNDTAHIYVDGDKETSNIVDTIAKSNDNSAFSSVLNNNFISDGNGLDDLSNKILSFIMDICIPFLKPVNVSYSNELLATQLYGISILLFILCILIIILLIAFMVNLLVYINSDKIINYFNNKYIKWYVSLNKKIIRIELFYLGIAIIYFMYTLSTGLHFLATHPITFN